MKRFISALKSNTAFYLYGVFFIFLVWAIVSLSQGYGNVVFPAPVETFKKTFELLSEAYIYKCIGMTVLKTLIGFGSSFVLAVILGILANKSPRFHTFLKPAVIVLKSAPTAAFIFLFLILVGSQYASVLIIFFLLFPILYESVVGGLANISPSVENALRIDAGKSLRSFFRVRLPLAAPYIVVGILSSLALSFKTSIMAEIISGNTNYGLGCAIIAYRSIDPTDLTPVFAIVLIAIVLVLIVDISAMVAKHCFDKTR